MEYVRSSTRKRLLNAYTPALARKSYIAKVLERIRKTIVSRAAFKPKSISLGKLFRAELTEMGTLSFHVDCVKRLAGSHE